MLLDNLGSKQSGKENWSAFSYKRKSFIKAFYKECGLENSSSSFLTLKNPPQKRIREVRMLILPYFDSFAIKHPVHQLIAKLVHF